jgi:hypothetical protein
MPLEPRQVLVQDLALGLGGELAAAIALDDILGCT